MAALFFTIAIGVSTPRCLRLLLLRFIRAVAFSIADFEGVV